MNPKRTDMKQAFQRLQVSRPLRLPKDGPGLVPPKPPEKEVPQSEAPTVKPAQNEVAHNEAPRKELPQREVSEHEAPQNEVAQGGFPRNETAQTEALETEPPQIEHAPAEQAQDELSLIEGSSSSAFFKLSPRVFADPTVRRMSGDCFRLFLWLSWRAWRYPNSPGVVRASVRFIEEETGMGHATVSRALKSLKQSGHVTLLETDFKRGNVWRVSGLASPGRSPEDPGTREPQNEAAQRKKGGVSNRGAASLKTDTKAPRNEAHIKKYKNLRNLSQEELQPLFDRIAGIAPPRKRESEAAHLETLLGTYAPCDLLLAVEHLESKGTLKGEKCHSPFSYLSFTAAEVMKRIAPAKSAGPEAHESDELLEGDRAKAVNRFEAELPPETREAFLSDFVTKEFPHGFLPPARVVKSLAALAWVSQTASPQFQLAV